MRYGFFAGMALGLVFLGCSSTTSQPQNKNGATGSTHQWSQVTLTNAQGHSSRVHAELAQTPEQQARGLMFRRQLASDQGMLFVYAQPRLEPFWMKNTPLPLDMLFIGPTGKIVDIKPSQPPLSEELIFSKQPYLFVLEVSGGYAEQHQLHVGDGVSVTVQPLAE